MADTIALPASSSPRLSLIVIAYQAGLVEACLRALAAHPPRQVPFELIVVLNAVPAAEVDALAARAPGVRFARSAANRGMAGAGNLGRSLASGELLLFLHDDVEVEPDCLDALVAALDAHPEAGAVGPKVLNLDGTLQFAGNIIFADGTTWVSWVGDPPPADAFAEPRPVDYNGTSTLLVRAATFDAAGGFDDRYYPVFYVDVDLAMAIRALGQVVWYEPRAHTRHHRGASSSSRFRDFVLGCNRAAFVAKWGGALDRHEPAGERTPELLERAMARARVWADEVARGAARAEAPPAAEHLSDERAYLEREVSLWQAFGARLEGELAAAQEAFVAMRETAHIAAGAANAWEAEALAARAREQAVREDLAAALSRERSADDAAAAAAETAS
ncbi:MAG TPA: glycosyltransferase [Thermoanaerobaculia bacterium]|nr:glycosyltransferase [Thermoanaerobaculia bacterium]